MRILLALILTLAAMPTFAASRVSALVTVTNPAGTTNGQTITINGSVRTFTNQVFNSGTQVLTNNHIEGVQTNLYNQLVSTMPANLSFVDLSGTNALSIVGGYGSALTVSISAGWGTLALSTNTGPTNSAILADGDQLPAAVRTNNYSRLANSVSKYSTNAIDQNKPIAGQLVGTTNSQTVGNKTFTNSTFQGGLATNLTIYANGGRIEIVTLTNVTVHATNGTLNGVTLTNALITNAVGISGIIGRLTNGTIVTPALYNATATNGFSSVGTGTFSQQFGTGAAATNEGTLAVGYNAWAHGFQSLAAGNGAWALTTNSVAIGAGALAGWDLFYPAGSWTVSIGSGSLAAADKGIAIGFGSTVQPTHTNSIAIGANVNTTAKDQFRLGSGSISVSVPQNLSLGNNLSIGNDWETAFVASLAKAIFIANGTAPSANPTNAGVIWVDSGKLKYRSSAADEGKDNDNFFHNRSQLVTGSGSDFSFPNTSYNRVDFGGTDTTLTLPTLGSTYLIVAIVSLVNGANANDDYRFKFFDSADAIDITSSDRRKTNIAAGQTDQVILVSLYTPSGTGGTIQLYGQNLSGARGSVEAARTCILYVRLN